MSFFFLLDDDDFVAWHIRYSCSFNLETIDSNSFPVSSASIRPVGSDFEDLRISLFAVSMCSLNLSM